MSAIARAVVRAVRREQPVRLPTERGGGAGVLVADASGEQLAECLAVDRRWLHGGQMVVDDETRQVTGFLNDASQNPGKWETAEEYLAHTDERSTTHRAVRRVALRIQAIEAELAERAEQQHGENVRRREQANAKLAAWRANVPSVVAEFQAHAEELAKDWALLVPIATALLHLQRMYPSAQGDIRAQYERLRVQHREIDEVVDPLNTDYKPLPDLPGLPTHQQVVDIVNVFNTGLDWPDSRVPSSGLEKINLQRTLRDAKGEF